ncbi:hypothetical protein [Sphingomonas sp. Leaf257]|jgi:hypothetical protein|uniref:hypothetical protein n=1 Tax=Sphingomonas sp. Leaf257 TaxID=1736309 RepID=UPI0012E1D75B|nr:hypothetical protein [Sphingomonas sp. Leaf257]
MKPAVFIVILTSFPLNSNASQSDYSAVTKGPDFMACELHIKRHVPEGGIYKLLSVAREDSGPLSPAAFKEQAGVSASVHGLGEAEALRNLADELAAKAGRLSLRRMVLTYRLGNEAQPRKQVCAFRLEGGKLQSAETLNANATSRTGEAIDFLADRGKWARQSKPKHSCCL